MRVLELVLTIDGPSEGEERRTLESTMHSIAEHVGEGSIGSVIVHLGSPGNNTKCKGHFTIMPTPEVKS